jgi:hypothetical protein
MGLFGKRASGGGAEKAAEQRDARMILAAYGKQLSKGYQ